MKVHEVPIGHTFYNATRGQGVIIARTARTLTAKFPHSTSKITYRYLNETFSPSDF
jgi:hypothetical protein